MLNPRCLSVVFVVLCSTAHAEGVDADEYLEGRPAVGLAALELGTVQGIHLAVQGARGISLLTNDVVPPPIGALAGAVAGITGSIYLTRDRMTAGQVAAINSATLWSHVLFALGVMAVDPAWMFQGAGVHWLSAFGLTATVATVIACKRGANPAAGPLWFMTSAGTVLATIYGLVMSATFVNVDHPREPLLRGRLYFSSAVFGLGTAWALGNVLETTRTHALTVLMGSVLGAVSAAVVLSGVSDRQFFMNVFAGSIALGGLVGFHVAAFGRARDDVTYTLVPALRPGGGGLALVSAF